MGSQTRRGRYRCELTRKAVGHEAQTSEPVDRPEKPETDSTYIPGDCLLQMIQTVLRDGEKLGMDSSAISRFHSLRDEGKLLKAEDPAHVVAALITRGTLDEPKVKDGSAGIGAKGEFVSWDEPQLEAFRREA